MSATVFHYHPKIKVLWGAQASCLSPVFSRWGKGTSQRLQTCPRTPGHAWHPGARARLRTPRPLGSCHKLTGKLRSTLSQTRTENPEGPVQAPNPTVGSVTNTAFVPKSPGCFPFPCSLQETAWWDLPALPAECGEDAGRGRPEKHCSQSPH